jgi:hypothetical protein
VIARKRSESQYCRGGGHKHGFEQAMKDDKKKGQRETGKAAKDVRQERLKQALRENLKRRKSQARGRDDFSIPSNSDDAVPGETGRKHPDN